MKRRAKLSKRDQLRFNIRKELKIELLAGVGACILIWNDIEQAIDDACCLALQIPPVLWQDVATRFHGLDGKLAILRKCLGLYYSGERRKIMESSLDLIFEHKKYRDGIAHARVIDPASSIADTKGQRGAAYEVLISEPAVDGLYAQLRHLRAEARFIVDLLKLPDYHGGKTTPPAFARQSARGAQRRARYLMILFRDQQKQRQALPALPQFPAELETLQTSELDPPRGVTMGDREVTS
jgi:hypothetical protein